MLQERIERTGLERVGRVLLALPFVLGGWEAARERGPRVGQAAAIGVKNPAMAVRANGIIMVVAGIALALGRLSRSAAAVLALVLVPTTIAGHAFWKETDSRKRKEQLAHFLKNLSMIGGLLEVVAGRHE
jgi:putative oxidoreductase